VAAGNRLQQAAAVLLRRHVCTARVSPAGRVCRRT
jgi:hypothetical protein